MKKYLTTVAGIAVLTALAGCGNHRQDRVLTGAAIGAGVGAVGGAVIGGDPLTGAVVGGVVGGVVAHATTGNVRMRRNGRHYRHHNQRNDINPRNDY